MTKKKTTIGHCTAFNNEQSPYRIVSYNIPLLNRRVPEIPTCSYQNSVLLKVINTFQTRSIGLF